MYKNEKGITLVEVMVAGALIAGLSVAILKMSDILNGVQRGAQQNLELYDISNRIVTQLMRSESCSYTLTRGESEFNFAKGATKINLTLYNKINGEPSVLISPDEELSTLKILEIKATRKSNPSNEVILEVIFKKIGGNQGDKTIKKNFVINAKFDQLDNVVSCYSAEGNAVETALQQSCEQLGGEIVEFVKDKVEDYPNKYGRAADAEKVCGQFRNVVIANGTQILH